MKTAISFIILVFVLSCTKSNNPGIPPKITNPNIDTPSIHLSLTATCLEITIYDSSFMNKELGEKVSVAVITNDSTVITRFEADSNGATNCVSFITGYKVVYKVIAIDCGNNSDTSNSFTLSYLDQIPRIKLENPRSFYQTIYRSPIISDTTDTLYNSGKINISFYIDSIPDIRLIKSVDFLANDSTQNSYIAPSLPPNLIFPNNVINYPISSISKPGDTLTLIYSIRVTDILNRTVRQNGSILLQGQ